ncbi:uncharacterized protein LOC100202149 isoform X1 [Hydra vulgaris]|uniref:Uncharacterized protein LOC100202149 isoform X1 n=1 Tax=Hydra vulgaris TaxID=6087 RepID=A0ABM4B6Z3_HYDVU
MKAQDAGIVMFASSFYVSPTYATSTTNMESSLKFCVCFVLIPFISGEPVQKLTIPSDTQPACRKNDIFHSDVIQDHSLKRTISQKNYTFLGKVPTMGDCMALCCSMKRCNIAYMKNDTCYGVTCFDQEKCGVENGTSPIDQGTQLALIIRNETNRRVYVTAYLVVVMCAFGAALSGTVWAVFVFYKRYSFTPNVKKKSNLHEEEGKEAEEPLLQRMHY